MNVVGYGGGTDSTAMLIGLWKHHIPVDLILFADPGGEQPHTYVYLEIMDRWLKSHDMPPITRVPVVCKAQGPNKAVRGSGVPELNRLDGIPIPDAVVQNES